MLFRSILPRLNFHFTLADFFRALHGLFISKESTVKEKLATVFPNSELFFTNHARTGIRLVLNSLQLPVNAKIGVLVYNCHTVFESIKQAGFTPVFIDCTNSYTMDTVDLAVKEYMLDGLIVTHLFGIPAKMDEIIKIMKGKPIIEDCAHSFMSKYKKKYLGTYGIAGVFSFGQSKFPSSGGGGFVIINNKIITQKFKLLQSDLLEQKKIMQLVSILKVFITAIMLNKYLYGNITKRIKDKYGSKIDVNSKFSFKEFKVNKGFLKVFESRLLNIDKYITKQNFNSKSIQDSIVFFRNEIEKNPNLNATFMYPIRTRNPEQLIKLALNNGFELGMHFSEAIVWAKNYGYINNNCPTAEHLIAKTITIPSHYKMTNKNLKLLINILKE